MATFKAIIKVSPNYEVKLKNGKTKVVNFITAQKLNKNERFDGAGLIEYETQHGGAIDSLIRLTPPLFQAIMSLPC